MSKLDFCPFIRPLTPTANNKFESSLTSERHKLSWAVNYFLQTMMACYLIKIQTMNIIFITSPPIRISGIKDTNINRSVYNINDSSFEVTFEVDWLVGLYNVAIKHFFLPTFNSQIKHLSKKDIPYFPARGR